MGRKEGGMGRGRDGERGRREGKIGHRILPGGMRIGDPREKRGRDHPGIIQGRHRFLIGQARGTAGVF